MKSIGLIFLFYSLHAAQVDVRGIVINAETEEPIAGASVLLTHTTIGTSTNSEGKFELKNIPNDRKTLTISALGYSSVEVKFAEEPNQELRIRLIPSPIQTQTIVVTANKRGQSLEDVPISMTVIGTQSLSQRNITAVDDALRYVSGVHFQQTQINIRASSGYSRGAGSRVALLFDGIPMLAGDTGEITFESIPVFQIEKIEIVKGAGSTLYGSGALGGVVNVITKDIDEHPKYFWKIFTGVYSPPSYKKWNWSDKNRFTNGQYVGYSNKIDHVGFVVSLHRIFDEGYREQDWWRRYSGFMKIKYDFSPFQSLTATTNVFHQYHGDFLWWKDLQNALRPADNQRNISVTSWRANSSLMYKQFMNEQFYFDVKATHVRGDWERDSLSIKPLDASRSDNGFIEAQGNLAVGDKNNFTFGIVLNGEQVHSNIFGIHSGIGWASYLQHEYSFEKDLTLTYGLRYDVHRVIGLDSYQQLNPKFGARYHVKQGTTLRASIGSGFRAPSVAEYYSSTSNTGSSILVIPNTALKPERGWSYEIGISHAFSEHLLIDAAVFRNDYSNFIEVSAGLDSSVSKTSAVAKFQNITQALIQGFETSVRMNFFNQRLSGEMHYNYNSAIDKNTKVFLRFRPKHIAGISSSFMYQQFNIGADFRYISRIEQIDDVLVRLAPINNGSERVPVYLLDSFISMTSFDQSFPIRIGVHINNLLNYNYAELIGNMSPPRQVMVSVEGLLQ